MCYLGNKDVNGNRPSCVKQRLIVMLILAHIVTLAFDSFQYANTEGEGLRDLMCLVTEGRHMVLHYESEDLLLYNFNSRIGTGVLIIMIGQQPLYVYFLSTKHNNTSPHLT